GAVHRRERPRGGPGSEPRRPSRLARPDAAPLLRSSRRGRRPPFCRLSLRHVGRSRRGGGRRTITVTARFEFLRPQLARWALPDAVEIIDAVPKTSVAKFDKKVLRERYKNWTP